MSQPEVLDQIRSARITASPELRARVRELAAVSPAAQPPRRELPWRRWSLVLVPACLVLALAGALAVGLATSGKKSPHLTSNTLAPAFSSEAQRDAATPAAPPSTKAAGAGAAGVAVSRCAWDENTSPVGATRPRAAF